MKGKEDLGDLCLGGGNNIKMEWHELKTPSCGQGQVAGSFKCSEFLD
jgi:hypothetical protein